CIRTPGGTRKMSIWWRATQRASGNRPGNRSSAATLLATALLSATLLLAPWWTAAASASPAAQTQTLLVLGDSLSAGYGMAREQSWVSLLAGRVGEQHPDWRVVNASMSGETTAGGAARIAAEMQRHAPDLLVL